MTPLVALACAYEIAALASRTRLPTISELAWRHPPLAWALLALAIHHAVAASPYPRARLVNAHRRMT